MNKNIVCLKCGNELINDDQLDKALCENCDEEI